jgi:DNA-directed RNA polymerase specialized sigma24 family protein
MSSPPGWAPSGPPLASDADRALEPYLLAADADDARARLGDLLQQVAAPVAWDVIRGVLRGVARSDHEDVHAGVLLALATHLRGARNADNGAAPIRDLSGYVATVAHNACHAFLRARSPHRAHLRSRVRYVLTRDPTLALWEEGARAWLCGAAAQRGAGRHADAASRLTELGRQIGGRASLPELIRALVRQLPGPARFDDLVDAVAAIQGIEDLRPRDSEAAEGDAETRREPPDPGPSPEAALARRDFLSRLWTEIGLLPPRQRAALLLNLRDADGRGMIALFPLTGTAALPDLASALEMPEEGLRAIWDDLPRDDAWIAQRLGVTPRQVINLRKCARERLARRMRNDAW